MVDHNRSDGQLCDRIFQNFCGKIFPVLEHRPDGMARSSKRTHVRCKVISITGFARSDQGVGAFGRLNFNTQFPYLIRVRPDHKGETSGRLKSNRQLPYTMHHRPDHSCQAFGQ
jgi:hypothetical protein